MYVPMWVIALVLLAVIPMQAWREVLGIALGLGGCALIAATILVPLVALGWALYEVCTNGPYTKEAYVVLGVVCAFSIAFGTWAERKEARAREQARAKASEAPPTTAG